MYPYYQTRDPNYPPYDPNVGYPPQPGFQPGYPPPQPGYPPQTGYPQTQPGYPQQPQYGAPTQPGYPPPQPGYGAAYPQTQPGYPQQPPTAGYHQYVDPQYQNMYNNIPPPMPLQPLTGKKKAVLIGINCKLHSNTVVIRIVRSRPIFSIF